MDESLFVSAITFGGKLMGTLVELGGQRGSFGGRHAELLQRLRLFYLHPNWQFRHGVILALIDFLRRGVLQPAQLQDDLDKVLASTPYFRPGFPLNERLRELSDLVRLTPSRP